MAATYYTQDKIDKLNEFKSAVPKDIYLPLNMGRSIPRQRNRNFKNERDSNSVSLLDWIQEQLEENNITVYDDNIVTTQEYVINNVTFPENTNFTDIINSLISYINNAFADLNYTHTQTTLSTQWIIPHLLNKYPSVTVIDDATSGVTDCDVTYNDANTITLNFSHAVKGVAYLN